MIGKKHAPIIVFDIEDFIPDKNRFIEKIRPYFYDLPWDKYDLRKKQIDFLKDYLPNGVFDKFSTDILKQYYLGERDITAINNLINQLPQSDIASFYDIKPFRRRSAMRYILQKNKNIDDWNIERTAINTFSQSHAKIEYEKNLDYRVYPRIFSETPEGIVDDVFFKIIKGIANMVKSASFMSIHKLDITVHHTYVIATKEAAGDNSPEGIHQDGYDYIVSALVIERNNILGGVSQIFSEDKKNRLLITKLHSGQGILQPDKGSTLWHNVTPFSVMPDANTGYRSSIGFDIALF